MAIAVVKTIKAQTALLARLMQAKAAGEDDLEMLMVGNVGVNRVRT
ncbi:MAG: cell wall hydrolase, partial [Lysinibacillus sp.]